jgi:DNA repair exonuclease SbcCD ATPase subunit
MAFRGEHVLALEATTYSVVAEYEGDSTRSNWAGKSSLLESVVFAFFGVLPGSHVRADAWISKGEDSGEVDVTLSDDTLVSRYRKPGAGTQLEVTIGSTGKSYQGDEAQRALENLIGLSLEDFRTTSWLAQGEASAIVRGDPAARTAMVSRWLGLEKVERALQLARQRAQAAEQALENVRAKARTLSDRATQLAEAEPPFGMLTVHEGRLLEWEQLLELATEEEAGRRLAEEREKISQECCRLRDELGDDGRQDLSQNVLTSREARDAARSRLQAAAVKRANRSSVASGAFNGRCPVAGIACPAKDQINDLGDAAREEAEAAEQAWLDAKTDCAAA